MTTRPKTQLAVGSGWLLYLAAATGCQMVFALFYGLVLARLSTFGWNRAYLLSALVLSAVLPLVALPAAWAQLLWPATLPAAAALPVWRIGAAGAPATTAPAAVDIPWLLVALAGYWLGVAWQAGRTARSLVWLYRLSRRHPRTRLGRGWLVQLPAPSRPAFSFGRSVFLSPTHAQLPAAEYAQLLAHEQVHGAQYHSCDLLLAEVIGWFFWFDGLVFYLRRELRTVHEYLADAAVARLPGRRAAYGHLLLKLAGGSLPTSLVHPFATKQVARRIHMLTFPPSSPMKKLRFLLIAPMFALAWVGAAALRPAPSVAATPPAAQAVAEAPGRIGTITWRGNKFLTSAQLNEALGLKPGDPYSQETLASTLAYRPDNSDVTSRYMDRGYLFFQATPSATTRPDGTTDLVITLNEGPVTRIGSIAVKGIKKVPTADVLALLPLHKGELFSRARLIQSQRALAESGFFDPANVGITPQPDPAHGLVNIEYVLIEK
jgi:hypothetical protein